MRDRGVGVKAWRVLAVLASCAAALQAQELPGIQETIEVRVVNVDVVVTDADGRPVGDLERQDFELEVNGRPVPLDYFSSIDGRSMVEDPAVGAANGESAPRQLPYLAIVYNGRGTSPGRARRAIATLSDRLEGLLERTRAMMVLRQGAGLVVEQRLTRDREELVAALDRLASAPPPLEPGDRRALLHEIENTTPPQMGRQRDGDIAAMQETMRRVADQQLAHTLLQRVRHQAQLERFAAEETNRQLRSVVRTLSGLPGRKAILLLGQGFHQRPGDAMYKLWWRKFSRHAQNLGVSSMEAEMGQAGGNRLLEALVDEANAHRVSVYSHDPAGLRTFGGSAEFGSLESNLEMAAESERAMDSLVDLSLSTGGVSRVDAAGLAPLLDEMVDGFVSYYSLGFDPGDAERGRVRVRLSRPGLKARYLKRFSVSSAAHQLEASTLATLLVAGDAENHLGVGVEPGRAERQEDGTFLLPLLIKVPISRVTLLPRRASHVGRLSFVVIAQAANGDLSPPAMGEVPIEIANSELLSTMGQVAGYRLRLKIRGGEHLVGIGVRDELAGQDSTLRVVLNPDSLAKRRSAARL